MLFIFFLLPFLTSPRRLLLPSSCPSITCPVPGRDQQSKFVMYRQKDRTWDVECRLFYDDKLPLVDGGSVEQRSLSNTDSLTFEAKAFKTKMAPVVAPSIDDNFELKQVLLDDSSVDSTPLTLELFLICTRQMKVQRQSSTKNHVYYGIIIN